MKTRVERFDSRGRVFLARPEAIGPGIFGIEGRMLLADEIRLGRDPEPVSQSDFDQSWKGLEGYRRFAPKQAML